MNDQKIALHISSLSFYTVSAEKKAGMPSMTRLVQEYARRGWRTVFVFPTYDRRSPSIEDGIEFYPMHFPIARNPSNSPTIWERLGVRIAPLALVFALLFQAIRFSIRLKPTIVYAHSIEAIVAAAWVKFLFRIPLVARIYGFSNSARMIGKYFFQWRGLFWNVLTALALKSAADLFVITKDGSRGEEIAKYWGISERTLVLRNGVEVPASILDQDPKAIKANFGLDASRPVVTFVGRLGGWKRPGRVIEAARVAKGRGLAWLFILLGDGPDKPLLEQKVRTYQLEDTVKFLGTVSHDAVWEYMRCSDVLLTLPEHSSLGNTLLEALAVGTPVVCSHLGQGLEELVMDGISGVLVEDPDDAEEVVSKIQAALTIPHESVQQAVQLMNWDERLEIEFERVQRLVEDRK
jgi:glycosyltransferase involved in cell wall biosynthesis